MFKNLKNVIIENLCMIKFISVALGVMLVAALLIMIVWNFTLGLILPKIGYSLSFLITLVITVVGFFFLIKDAPEEDDRYDEYGYPYYPDSESEAPVEQEESNVEKVEEPIKEEVVAEEKPKKKATRKKKTAKEKETK